MAPTLRDTQQRIARAIVGGDFDAAASLVRDDRLPPAARIGIHRHHFLTSLATALGENFPATRRLVGDDFFNAAARRYVATDPPREPCLSAYGAGFAGFLAGFEPAQPLPYLPDVARLEWARIEVTFAGDEPVLDLAAVGALPADQQGNVTLALRPSARLLSPDYPVDAIWQAHQHENVSPVDLNAGSCRLLVWRAGNGVRIERLDAGTYAFFTAAAHSGTTLQTAIEAALRADTGFDLAQALAMHRTHALLADTLAKRAPNAE